MTFYRFHDFGVSHGSEEYGFYSTRQVELQEFRVIRETPKGVWIETTLSGDKRFVRVDARKQYACSTVELAKQSFIARKKRQIKILTKQLNNAKEALGVVKEWRAEAEAVGTQQETATPSVSFAPKDTD